MSKSSQMDWDIIDARVKKYHMNNSNITKSMAFLSIVIEQIFPGTEGLLPEIITDGSDDRGIDAIYFTESDESADIFIFQAKYRDSYATIQRTINDQEILKISLFLEELFNKSESLRRCNNFKLKQAVERIWDLHERGKICRYNVIFCSNGAGFAVSAQNIIGTICQNHTEVKFEFYGTSQIIEAMSLEGRKSENGHLQVIGKEILERSDGDVRGVIASVDAPSFIKLITTEDGVTIKRHLFDDNLRVFLGAKGGYNQAIINTATSSDGYLFWYLNNGVTITCKRFSYNKGHTNPTLRFEDFQIVNGAQTSHSLVEATRIDPNALNDVVLMVRIYATDRSDISERVAIATNSQARIQSRDLRSNHPNLKKLELALQERGYFFERKKNMHSEMPADKRIDALKLGQIILSFYLREPDRARTESDAIFGERFDQIFNIEQDVDELVRLYELFSIIERRRDAYSSENVGSIESGHENQYLIYGYWFVLFACNLLHIKSGRGTIPVGAEAEELVAEAIRRVAASCSQNKAVAHYQMFRSPKTKERIYGEISAKQLDLFDLLAVR